MAGLRNVSVVFYQRKYFERDKFCHRKQFSREKNCFSRGTFADCKNYVRARRAYFFCRNFIFNVRDLRLFNLDLQPANNLLFFRDDLPFARDKLADEFADGFFARRGTIRGDAPAVWILGNADFLEFEHDSRKISVRAQIKSRILFG